MGYKECLEKAGAEVIDFEEFGTYSGDWLAFVNWQGEKGIVHGYYGSCSGCDSFLAQFGYSDEPIEKQEDGFYYTDNNYWDEDSRISAEEAAYINNQLEQKYAEFGMDYLKNGIDNRQYWEKKLHDIENEGEDDWFSQEEKPMAEWALKQPWDEDKAQE